MQRTVMVFDRQFARFARPAIHEKIGAILGDYPRGKLLDLPAGSGALSYRLHKEGFAVTGCDIAPENFEPGEIPIVSGDLRERFPFDDASFDYATFVEGPEHAENPMHAFREYARILKPGGRLIVTLPNYTNLEMRIRYLLMGSTEKFITPEVLQSRYGGHVAMVHITPLAYTQLKFFLDAAGFEIERVERDVVKRKQLLLAPLAAAIRLAANLLGGRSKFVTDEANSSPLLMGGNTLILVARLRGAAAVARAA